ncbi:Sugar transport protein 4 [Striga hermonthica]|uniref:Sugar transport protein 4 n=1 Tax=Striga hermonthica TaxID=68872 RepID=A0A9N7NRS8_STRHE|nr:Sugar transport protein 4 [Striga hermonthica]
MAIGGAISSGVENVHYNGKVTVTVMLSCIIAATGGLLFGYDTGVTGGVTSMEAFLKKFFPEVYTNMNSNTQVSNYCKFDSQLLTAFSSSIYVSGLIASFFASRVTMEYGRKRSIIYGGIAFFSGAAIGGAAENLYTLMMGRLLLGVGVGFANQAVPLYLSEMAPSKYRGAFNFGFQCFVSVGSTGAFILNYVTSEIGGDLGWRISLATAVVPASVLILGTLFLPETPNSLIQRGHDTEDARKLLQKIRGTDDMAIGGIMAEKLGDHGALSPGYNAAIVVLICAYVTAFGFSWGPLGWLVTSEIFPLEIRSTGQSITVAVSFLFSFVIGQVFLAILCHLKSGTFFFFGGWVAFMTGFVFFLLPETKNVPIEKMDKIWREHWFWRRAVEGIPTFVLVEGETDRELVLKVEERRHDASVVGEGDNRGSDGPDSDAANGFIIVEGGDGMTRASLVKVILDGPTVLTPTPLMVLSSLKETVIISIARNPWPPLAVLQGNFRRVQLDFISSYAQ